jgi:hypothetical protein
MISGKVTGRRQLSRMQDELMLIDASYELWIEAVALAARQYVVHRLNTDFPQYAPHFEVIIMPNPESVMIQIKPVDEVGTYLYEGTEPHMITGDSMPVGADVFAQSVNHPGTKSIKEELDGIVAEAIAISEMSVFV